MLITRRGLIGGFAALLPAPAIVRVANLMPMRVLEEPAVAYFPNAEYLPSMVMWRRCAEMRPDGFIQIGYKLQSTSDQGKTWRDLSPNLARPVVKASAFNENNMPIRWES